MRLLAFVLAWSPDRQVEGAIKHFEVFWEFMNEMNECPFKSFRLLRKNTIEIIPNIVQNPVFIW